ncbi:PEP-CTERM sorting domain-containing protein [Ideonella sp. A 288]|uniref:PEP-CTERM sorting domain-containing protein n=1 Tax=Ideonella sp. A 288 TaxID=1962181 RepID=UPI000B4C0923|nr:PEP-CTERM sorting domain-containing protein [Ideonella sp. A 288]
MRTSLLRCLGTASLLCFTTLGLQAAPLTLAGSGATVDFYYDAAYWGAAPSFTISGDNITFNRIGLTAFTPGEKDFGGDDAQSRDAALGEAALIAVARAGFSFAGGYSASLGFSGSYELDGSGLVAAVHGSDLHAGSFGGGVFSTASVLGSLFSDAVEASSGAGPLSGTSAALAGTAGAGQVLALVDLFANVAAFQDDLGDTGATIDSLNYTISAARLNAVPEPASLLLVLTMLAGLAAVRRR